MHLGRAFQVTDAAIVACNVTESEAAWSAVTTYAATNVVRRTVAGVHRRFVSQQNGNTNHDPETDDGTWWLDDGPTNRFAMFDNRLGVQTARADSISVTLQAVGRIDTVYVGNVSAQEMTVAATDAIEGEVYSATVPLVSTSRITDWARYFREPIVNLRSKGLMDLPSGYADLEIEVTLTDPGETVACGELVLAFMADLGGTQWGAGLGSKSYSRIQENEVDGEDDIVRRGSKATRDYGVVIANSDLDDVVTLLEDCDARPILFVGNDTYNAMFTFGLLLSWKKLVEWPDHSALTLQIQGFVQ